MYILEDFCLSDEITDNEVERNQMKDENLQIKKLKNIRKNIIVIKIISIYKDINHFCSIIIIIIQIIIKNIESCHR